MNLLTLTSSGFLLNEIVLPISRGDALCIDCELCRLTGLLYDATLAINSGGTIEADYFTNGASSMNVQV